MVVIIISNINNRCLNHINKDRNRVNNNRAIEIAVGKIQNRKNNIENINRSHNRSNRLNNDT